MKFHFVLALTSFLSLSQSVFAGMPIEPGWVIKPQDVTYLRVWENQDGQGITLLFKDANGVEQKVFTNELRPYEAQQLRDGLTRSLEQAKLNGKKVEIRNPLNSSRLHERYLILTQSDEDLEIADMSQEALKARVSSLDQKLESRHSEVEALMAKVSKLCEEMKTIKAERDAYAEKILHPASSIKCPGQN